MYFLRSSCLVTFLMCPALSFLGCLGWGRVGVRCRSSRLHLLEVLSGSHDSSLRPATDEFYNDWARLRHNHCLPIFRLGPLLDDLSYARSFFLGNSMKGPSHNEIIKGHDISVYAYKGHIRTTAVMVLMPTAATKGDDEYINLLCDGLLWLKIVMSLHCWSLLGINLTCKQAPDP